MPDTISTAKIKRNIAASLMSMISPRQMPLGAMSQILGNDGIMGNSIA
jgi:hypothetical protein